MRTSLQNSAQLTETAYADVTKLSEHRKQVETERSWNTWLMYAVIKALQEHPYMNGTLEDGYWKEGNSITIFQCAIHIRSEEHTSELQSRFDLVCRLLLEKKKE